MLESIYVTFVIITFRMRLKLKSSIVDEYFLTKKNDNANQVESATAVTRNEVEVPRLSSSEQFRQKVSSADRFGRRLTRNVAAAGRTRSRSFDHHSDSESKLYHNWRSVENLSSVDSMLGERCDVEDKRITKGYEKCPFSYLGCSIMGTAIELEIHCKRNNEVHLKLACKLYTQHSDQIKELKKENMFINERYLQSLKEIELLTLQCDEHIKSMDTYVKNEFDFCSSNSVKNEQSTGECMEADNDGNDLIGRISNLKLYVARMQQKYSHLLSIIAENRKLKEEHNSLRSMLTEKEAALLSFQHKEEQHKEEVNIIAKKLQVTLNNEALLRSKIVVSESVQGVVLADLRKELASVKTAVEKKTLEIIQLKNKISKLNAQIDYESETGKNVCHSSKDKSQILTANSVTESDTKLLKLTPVVDKLIKVEMTNMSNDIKQLRETNKKYRQTVKLLEKSETQTAETRKVISNLRTTIRNFLNHYSRAMVKYQTLEDSLKDSESELCRLKGRPQFPSVISHNHAATGDVKNTICFQIDKVHDIMVESTRNCKDYSVESKPFYTCTPGYHCQFRVVIYKNMLKFYFRLRHGIYDNVLNWPFNKTICLNVNTDPSKPNQRETVLTVRTDNMNFVHTCKPVLEQNIAYKHEDCFDVTQFARRDDSLFFDFAIV
ncbi:uncharacterized protein LOC130623684 [Hydractinia symbiolongicarpus]|uniref:uncharacterized protein LOC130623684 n=1 Tax=Hydractinia symbiolongicarpus TaxID=13093 RepID=UPI002550146D|nr:uncharacterized protein LOC130623684 [Hydractinia symbiolongicarpus]